MRKINGLITNLNRFVSINKFTGMNRFISIIILAAFLFSISLTAYGTGIDKTHEFEPFSDVPAKSPYYNAVHELRKLGITDGIGNNKFGFGNKITRKEFITFIKRALKLEQPESALTNGIISGDSEIILDPHFTREEAAIIAVNALGLGNLAKRLDYLDKPFPDAVRNIGYISIVNDLKIISDISGKFHPEKLLLREEAAGIITNILNIINNPLDELNGFYAISSSSQKDKIQNLSSVCFGWSKISYDSSSGSIFINKSRNAYGYNDYYLPQGFSSRLAMAKVEGIPALLMIQSSQDEKITDPSGKNKIGIPEYVLSNPEVYRKLINDIVNILDEISLDDETGSFNGVVIDFEGLKGTKLKKLFNSFLKELNKSLDEKNKLLYVAVHPARHPKRDTSYFDGYDYRTIGSLADKVILMAHDYNAKKLTDKEMERGFCITPLAPLEDVYYALKEITNSRTGIKDRSKIMLQISFDWVVWQRKDGKVINSTPKRYNLENFIKLLKSNKNIEYYFDKQYYSPYVKFTDQATGIENIVWYENTTSVMEKVKLARYFGISGISLWRLGLIPDYESEESGGLQMDVWQKLLSEMEHD